MSINRKLFVAMASLIVAMGLVFVLMTEFVVRGILVYALDLDRSKEIEELSNQIIGYYQTHQGSWDRVRQLDVSGGIWSRNPDAGFLLMSLEQQQLYKAGAADDNAMMKLGMKSSMKSDGETIAFLYYYDREVANISIIKLGISSSVTFLLLAGAIVFVLISLLIAYWLSKRLTLPLRVILPAIDRLGKGEFGIQAPIVSKDEYGKVAQAFNEMSLQIKRAEEVRRNMAADVAHELRTPITIIRGKLDLIQQSGRSIEPESLLPLQDELIRLTRLVDDLHQLSLAEARKLSLEQKQISIPDLLRQIIERIAPAAEDKNIEISLNCENGLRMIDADPNRLTQVFLNLLGNAVRYTPEGGTVHVAVEEPKPMKGEKSMQRITIADTGMGIGPGHLPFLFDRFYRTDEARTRNSGGMGLGLAIAKELVLMHNGTIEAESSPGEGTTFIVKLP